MQVKVENLPKSTTKLTITLPSAVVAEAYEKAMIDIVNQAELPGFRKGMAPKDMVKDKIDTSKLYGDVINKLLQTYYPQALKENNISPVSNPKVEIKEFDIAKDFEFTATFAVRPEIKVGDYKPKLKESYENKIKAAREENARKLAEGQPVQEPHVHLSANDAIEEILKVTQVDIPEILVEEETDRMMARLVDQAQTIGLSLDQYLKAQNKTQDQLKADYAKMAERSLKAEFALSNLVKEQNVIVSDEEVTEAIVASGQDPEKFKDNVEKWYIKSVLEKNKLLSNLVEAAEVEGGRTGDHNHAE